MSTLPNVLVIHAHDLGRQLHCLGAQTVQSPNLDKLAASGVRFEHAFTVCPTCCPSRGVLYTGLYPSASGVMGMCCGRQKWDLAPEVKHLAQHLGAAGYATTAIGVHHESSSGPERCGFESYQAPQLAESAVDLAIPCLEKLADSDRPFYLQVAVHEPHRYHVAGQENDGFIGDYLEPDDELGVAIPGYLLDTPGTREELAEFQGAVRHMDRHVGRLLAALEERSLSENTLVVFTTDHGAAFPRAKATLHDPGIENALLLRLPNRPGWNGGKCVSHMISNVDIVPTILEALGLEVPAPLQGRSFAPLLDGGDDSPRQEIFCEQTYHGQYDPKRGIRTERYKLFLHFASGRAWQDCSQSWRPRSSPVVHRLAPRTDFEFYDLEKDPWELENIWQDPDTAEVRADLLARLRAHMEKIGDPILTGPVDCPTRHMAMSYLKA
jgi:N-sulfoglucosamine sulfohydrolase